MKKVLLVLFAIIIGINLNTQAESFSAIYNGKTIYYNITSSTSPLTVAVTYRGSTYNSFTNEYSGNVSIPDSVLYNGNSYKVTSIDEYSVYNCPNLTSISIPSSITSIGSYAFYNCSSLTSITIPNSVTSIGNGVFKNCSGLTSLSIPNYITVIGNECFFGCIGLTSIAIPDSITSFGFNAFYNCYGLTSISIPNTVTSIGYGAFSNCSGLTSITIPDSITSIGNATFKNCSGLTSLIIPSSVSSIGTEAFYGCSGLSSIIIPDLVTSIAAYSFYGCTGLTSITIPDSVTSIDFAAFQNCSGLTSITIPNSIISIYGFAFKNCNSLNTLYFNALNCSLLGEGFYPAFDNSKKLSTIIIGDSVINIPNYAFSYCTGLASITISNSVTSIGKNAFYNCFSLTSIRIPNSVTSIGNGAFENCSALTSVTIPNSVTSIGVGAFQNCSALTSIILPNSITSIENSTFSNCTNLKSIIIPSSVTSIHNSAFYNCIFLSSIICQAIIPPTINNFSFGNVKKYIPLYVPCNSFSSYDSALYWSDFTNIVGIRAFQLIDTSICKGQTYTSNGFNNNLTGLYSQNLQTINSCDSLIILNLFVNPTYNDTIFAEICFGDTYSLNGFNINTAGFYSQNLQSIKGCDSIVNLSLIVNPIYNDTIFAKICSNETYAFNGFNVNTAGFFTQNLQTIKGCDSIVNLSLIVNPIYNDTIIVEICNGETYSQYGFNESETGFYTQSLQSIKGCDSIVNLSLFVNPIYNDTIIAEICTNETYTLNGFNESNAGFYTQNLQTIKGCDSIVNLSLIVNPIYLTNHYDTICQGQSYNNYGFNFIADTSGLYTQNLQTTKGCDSIINLYLIVNPIYNYTIQAEICSNEIYTLNGFNTNTAGFYTQNLQTIKGCDSIVNLNLIVNPTYYDTIIAEICQGETYSQFGFNENSTGFYSQSLQTTKGCDSIVNLSLIVNPIYNDTIFATICSGVTYSLYGFNETSIGFYTQSLQTTKGCDSIVNLSLDVVFPPTVELNMVTVDMNNNNVVVWDKDEVVNHYNIYREGNVANQFDLIATVPYDSASMFVDTNSNPTIKAYMYKISTTDTCLNESELSPFHKTMHLTISQGMGNNWNLSWTPYVGTNYSTYNIYRGINTLDSLQFLTTISTSNTSYTDINVPNGYVYYQIEIIIDTTESKTGGDNSIRSNYATNKLISIEGVYADNITTKLYPNPSDGKAKLNVEGLNTEADVLVYDMVGRVVQRHSLNKGKNDLEIDLSGYAKGVYSVRIVNDSINQTLKLVVQ